MILNFGLVCSQDSFEGKAGRDGGGGGRDDDKVEVGEEEEGLRRVKMRSGMIGGILTASLSLSLCWKAIAIKESISR